jgi:hypothetical protein
MSRAKQFMNIFEDGGKDWDDNNFLSPEDAKMMGDRRVFDYVPFHQLSPKDQDTAVRAYVYKSVGGKYDFRDEHYYYPIDRQGDLAMIRARRVLAIPKAKIDDDEYMKSLGYEVNPNWRNK